MSCTCNRWLCTQWMDRLACLYLTRRDCALIEVFWMQVLSMMYTSRLQVVVTCKHFWLGKAPQQAPHFVWTIVSVLFVRVYVKTCVHFMWSLLIYGQSFTCLARTQCAHCAVHTTYGTLNLFSAILLSLFEGLCTGLSLYTGNTLTSPVNT